MNEIQGILKNTGKYKVLFDLVSDPQKPDLQLEPMFLQRSNPAKDGLAKLTEYKNAVVAYVMAIMTEFSKKDAVYLTPNKSMYDTFVNSIQLLLKLPEGEIQPKCDYKTYYDNYKRINQVTEFSELVTNINVEINTKIDQATTDMQAKNTAQRILITKYIDDITTEINNIPLTNGVQTKLADANQILTNQILTKTSEADDAYNVAKSKKDEYEYINKIEINDSNINDSNINDSNNVADYNDLYTQITNPQLVLSMYKFDTNKFTLKPNTTLEGDSATNEIPFDLASRFFKKVNTYYTVLDQPSTYSSENFTKMQAGFIQRATTALAELKIQAESAAETAGNAYITKVNAQYTEFNNEIADLNRQISSISDATTTEVIQKLHHDITYKNNEIDAYVQTVIANIQHIMHTDDTIHHPEIINLENFITTVKSKFNISGDNITDIYTLTTAINTANRERETRHAETIANATRAETLMNMISQFEPNDQDIQDDDDVQFTNIFGQVDPDVLKGTPSFEYN